MKNGDGSESIIIISPSKSVLVYVLHSLKYVLALARFRVFVPKLYYISITAEIPFFGDQSQKKPVLAKTRKLSTLQEKAYITRKLAKIRFLTITGKLSILQQKFDFLCSLAISRKLSTLQIKCDFFVISFVKSCFAHYTKTINITSKRRYIL